MDNYTNIYMLGIKGAGMSSLAAILAKMGKRVWGSDVQTREPADALLEKHSIVVRSFDVGNITSDIDLLITTGAHGGLNNPEVLQAKKMGIPVMTHAEALGKIMDQFQHRVAVCGTHGKTTVSSLISFLLVKMGVPCGYQVGAPSFSGLPGGNYDGDTYFVVESDEYVASPGVDYTPRFMFQNPTHILCLNVEHDHVDVYKTLEDVKNAFHEFFKKLPDNGVLIHCADDHVLSDIVESITHVEKYSYGVSEDAFARVSDVSVHDRLTTFTITIDGKDTGRWETQLSGEHNCKNIAGVITFFYTQGFNLHEIKEYMRSFNGSKRRFELIFENESHTLIDDYAHHPTEIRETLKGARMLYPNRRIVVFFQPHTFSRTDVFKQKFIEALSLADKVFILDIYGSAREHATQNSITSEDIVEGARSMGHTHIYYLPNVSAKSVATYDVQSGDVIITMGATDIYKLQNDIIEAINS